jgi:hypothetical protein
MTKKRLNKTAVLNELSGQSVFFKEPEKTERNTERKTARTEIRSEERTENRTVDIPIRRRTKRYSFEFYEDQLVRLRQMKIKAQMKGESVFLSEIVRQALDEFFSKHDSTRSEKRTEVRSNGNTVGIPNEKRPA